MARKKEPLKPLLSLKHDFYASLDATIQHSIMLITAVEFALKQEGLPPSVKAELTKTVAVFRASVFNED